MPYCAFEWTPSLKTIGLVAHRDDGDDDDDDDDDMLDTQHWKTRADELVSTIRKVSAKCSELEGARVQAEDRYREAEAKMQRHIEGDAQKDRQIRDLRLELAKALRDVEQLCSGTKPSDQGWRKDAGPEVEEQLAYLEKEMTRWKKEALEMKIQLADERSKTARATRAWQEDWASDLAKQHFSAAEHYDEVWETLSHHYQIARLIPQRVAATCCP